MHWSVAAPEDVYIELERPLNDLQDARRLQQEPGLEDREVGQARQFLGGVGVAKYGTFADLGSALIRPDGSSGGTM